MTPKFPTQSAPRAQRTIWLFEKALEGSIRRVITSRRRGCKVGSRSSLETIRRVTALS